jgi:hypothetical protein
MHIPNKIISGGQTGADIGGLVGAKRAGIKTGGMAPRDYKTEAGNKPEELKAFGLISHPSPQYSVRTKENVKGSDATLILATDPSSDGTAMTIQFCQDLKKPYLVANPFEDCEGQIRAFINETRPSILNIAGNRESRSKGLAARTASLIALLFKARQ